MTGRGTPPLDVGSEAGDRGTRRFEIVTDALVREVQHDFEAGDDFHDLIAQSANPFGQVACERARRECDSAIGPRADHQRDGLGLGEIEAAVEECPPGELARRRQPRAAGDDPLRHHPQQRRGAMTRELDDVLARVRARRAHDGAERFVDALVALRVDDADPAKCVRGELRERDRALEQGTDDRDRVRPADANHPDGALTYRRRDGGDRIVGAGGFRLGRRLWPRASRACARVGP